MGGTKAPLLYAKADIKIFPVKPNCKEPKPGCSWRDEATADEDQIRKWFNQEPQPNVGIPAEENNLVIVDVDGAEGKRNYKKLSENQPPTPTAETPHGVHYYYKAPEQEIRNSAGTIAPGIDIRGAGGYAVAPPSTIKEDEEIKKYQWLSFLSIHETDPAEFPDWLKIRCGDSTSETVGVSGRRDSGQGPAGQFKQASYYEPQEGEIICPLFKYEDRYGTEPLEAPEPGNRNEWLFYQALTHFNLGLSEDYFRAVFYQKIWPKMDKSAGHDGERFTSKEAHRTIKNAKEAAAKFQENGGSLSPRVIEYHRYRDDQDDDQGGGQNSQGQKQTRNWTTEKAKMEIMSFILKYQPEYTTEGAGTAYEQLINDVAQQSDETGKRGKIPRRTLARALRQLRETGIIRTVTNREGTGHVLYLTETAVKNDSPVPRTRMNGAQTQHQRGFRARRKEINELLNRAPPNGELEGEISDYIDKQNGKKIPEYPRMEQLRKNAGGSELPSAIEGVHLLAWITEDPEFSTWAYKQEPLELWPALKDYAKYEDEIENPGGWFRTRIFGGRKKANERN